MRAWHLVLCAAAGIMAATGHCAHAEERRLFVDGQLNGRAARFVLDTGTSFSLAMPLQLMPKFDVKLATEVPANSPDSAVIGGFSAPVRLKFPPDHREVQAVAALFKGSSAIVQWDIDALIGWERLRTNQLHYAPAKGVTSLGADLGIDTRGWGSFAILPWSVLVLDARSGTDAVPVMVDTGWPGGLDLSPSLWRAWRAANPSQPYTLVSHFTPGLGFRVRQQYLARSIQVGAITFHNILVSEALPSPIAGADMPAATIGLNGFAGHELLVDGQAGKLFLRAVQARPAVPSYNRLGATFPPDTMAAHVAPNSPAARADIRDGDLLVAIDGMPPERYAEKIIEHNVSEQPAGTRMKLTLERSGTRIERPVVLEDFLEE